MAEKKNESLNELREQLLEMMEQAETMSDLLAIESRLTEVNYQLESVASKLKTLENQVSYATVRLYITEVQEYTPVVEKTVWQRITEGFADSLECIWDGAVEIFVWILANSPYLVLVAIFGAAAVKFVKKRKIQVKRAPRKDKKAEE